MKKLTLIIILFFLLNCLMCLKGFSETLHLKDGMEIIGKVVEESEVHVKIKVFGGYATVKKKDIVRIDRDDVSSDLTYSYGQGSSTQGKRHVVPSGRKTGGLPDTEIVMGDGATSLPEEEDVTQKTSAGLGKTVTEAFSNMFDKIENAIPENTITGRSHIVVRSVDFDDPEVVFRSYFQEATSCMSYDILMVVHNKYYSSEQVNETNREHFKDDMKNFIFDVYMGNKFDHSLLEIVSVEEISPSETVIKYTRSDIPGYHISKALLVKDSGLWKIEKDLFEESKDTPVVTSLPAFADEKNAQLLELSDPLLIDPILLLESYFSEIIEIDDYDDLVLVAEQYCTKSKYLRIKGAPLGIKALVLLTLKTKDQKLSSYEIVSAKAFPDGEIILTYNLPNKMDEPSPENVKEISLISEDDEWKIREDPIFNI